MTESMFIELKAQDEATEAIPEETNRYEEEMPHFLQDESVEVEV